MRRITALLASLALLLTLVPAAALAAPSATGTWIVTLRDDVRSATVAHGLARQHGGQVGHLYTHALNGFSFRGSHTAATALMRNPNVLLVEADAEVWLDATQNDATWGLDRIDQRDLPLSGTYTYERTGNGVTAYVIDSGIRFSHNQFDGRAAQGADFVGDGQNGNDCNGHGTHVAGTIGGSVHGVAKNVQLVSVRVFGCSGGSSWETIIAGIDWVTANAKKPAVANMSLGGGSNTSVDTATRNMISSGVATAVAAGNGNFIGRQADACNYSPARVAEAMTVSATSSNDAKASWANYGNCVDWFAPGVSITSAWHTSNTATNTISGTSMASPHTAGVAALYLEGSPGASAQQVREALYNATTKNKVTSSSTTNNHLLYSGFIGGGGSSPSVPVANFSASPTSGSAPLTVQFTDTSSGSPTSWSWNFGDGTTSTAQHPSKTYSSAGSYSVTLTATNATGSNTVTKSNFITVSAPSAGITLSATGYKIQGVKHADLSWSGASASYVDIFRDNTKVAMVANGGSYTDNTGQRGGGTTTYRICEANTSTCSNSVTVSH
jgi:subtilisin family serine protease